MTPVKFDQANTIFAANQSGYRGLPAYYDRDDPTGLVVSCWSLGWRERLGVLFRGRLYLSVLTFHRLLQPQLPTTSPPFDV